MEYKIEKVIGYEEYSVDTNGVIYSKRGRPLKYSINPSGYQIVNFYVNHHRKGFAIHTIVAKQFIPNTDVSKTQVNHKDGNKQNNKVENLEWVTPRENVRHAIDVLGYDKTGANNPNAKSVTAYYCDGTIYKVFPSLVDAAKEFVVGSRNPAIIVDCIWRALHGIRHTYKGYYWRYT